MPATTLDMETVYARAAALRADGWSWHGTADRVGLDENELKILCRASASYKRHLTHARREMLRETLAASVLVLRVTLRTGEPTDAHKAAEALCRIEGTMVRHRNARARDRAKLPPPDPRLKLINNDIAARRQWVVARVEEELVRLDGVFEKIDPNNCIDRGYAEVLVMKRENLGELVYPGDLPPSDDDDTSDEMGDPVPHAPTDPSAPTSGSCPLPVAGEGGRASRPGEVSPPEHSGIAAPWYVSPGCLLYPVE